MQDQPVLISTQGRVGVLTLNRPQQLNALNDALMDALGAARHQDRGITEKEEPRESDGSRGLFYTKCLFMIGTQFSRAEIAVEAANTKIASSGTEKKALHEKVSMPKCCNSSMTMGWTR